MFKLSKQLREQMTKKQDASAEEVKEEGEARQGTNDSGQNVDSDQMVKE